MNCMTSQHYVRLLVIIKSCLFSFNPLTLIPLLAGTHY